MRKNLIAALASFGLCAAIAAIVAGTAQADAPKPLVSQLTPAALGADTPAPDALLQLAQAAPPPSGRGAPPPAPGRATGRGRAAPARPAPTAAQLAARRTALCQDRYARAAGNLAALEVRLNLNPAQGAAFTRWRDVRLAAAKQAASECAARPAPQGRGGRGATTATPAPPSPVERMAREETMLQQRLSQLQSERPALDALYTSLTPAQRQVFARQGRPMMGAMRGRAMFAGRGAMRGPGFGRGPGGRGPGMRGPGGRGPGGPGMRGPMRRPPPPRGGANPPPPPPQ